MKFRNYCIVVMGDTKNIVSEIVKIAETKPNVLDARGIVIATFSSVVEPRELTEFFIENNRNFFIFDLNPENSGFHMLKEDVHNGLFGFLDMMGDKVLRNKTNQLISEISASTINRNTMKTTYNSENRLGILQEKLNNAVEVEDYDLAIKIRDEISKLGK